GDAWVCRPLAVFAPGGGAEAQRQLGMVEKEARARGDAYRLKRLRAVRAAQGGKPAAGLDPRSLGEARVRLGERALRTGDHASALEHFREGRVLLEATSGTS